MSEQLESLWTNLDQLELDVGFFYQGLEFLLAVSHCATFSPKMLSTVTLLVITFLLIISGM